MTAPLEIRFAALTVAPASTTVVFSGAELALGETARALDEKSGDFLSHAAKAADFTGKPRQSIEVLAAPKIGCPRVLMFGVAATMSELDQTHLGGRVLAAIRVRRGEAASIVAEVAGMSPAASTDFACALAEGALLRSYEFRRYKSRDQDETGANGTEESSSGIGNGDHPKAATLSTLTIHVSDPERAAEQFKLRRAVVEGVMLARELVNEPANILGPVEFAERVQALTKAGVDVEILDVPALEKLKMGALLGVAMGSVRPARVAIMQWHGAKAKKRAKPVCFVGKGVVFDTGGISMKPAAGMEDMKGDMGGAACVTGLMHALASRRKAATSMPSGSSGSWKTCHRATPSALAISSPPCPGRQSKYSTRMRRGASCSPMCCGTRRSGSSRG